MNDMKSAYLIFNGRGDGADFCGVFSKHSYANAEAQYINHKNVSASCYIEHRKVTKKELEHIMGETLTDKSFEEWGK